MKYTGLSIGPIYKTMMYAKKTRELWGSSYIFSYFMKEIIKKLLKKGIRKEDFITPYIDDESLNEVSKVGKFHDRLIYKGDKKVLEEAINEVKQEFSDMLHNDLKAKKDDVFNFVDSYFRFFIIEKELDENFDDKTHPIKIINDYLNSKELFFKVKNYKKNYLFSFLKLSKNKNTLFKTISLRNFKSLPEIAFSELGIKYNYNDDEIETFNKIAKTYNLKPYHKYIAIVHADGDNLSKALKGVREDINNEVRNISTKLFNFSKEATNIIEKFGAEVIYAGGDDILFFAPVMYNKKSIFALLNELKVLYEKQNIKNSTISFGVSITYYKYPLNEALTQSRELLFDKAKCFKNTTAFKVIKHSGQMFEGRIYNEIYDEFLDMINFALEDEEFLHSLYTKIAQYKKVLEYIKEERIQFFFENYFNENYKRYEKFFKLIENYFIKLRKNEEKLSECKDKAINSVNNLYSTIRFMKFLKGDK